ncbi:hypothetical protein QJS04_geneDACA018302 [Acorus gramineus]|uniref:Uncharacterized protein n=1 Tax=Acorus gramineus TaxID=55184 RepID=A0AAV9BDA9_ACOGR|nr:hypothetical protein QJS04_geneDACA018302 [Acorus gramineus]
MVFVPFTKKEQQKPSMMYTPSDQNMVPPPLSADSTWSELMADLSTLNDNFDQKSDSSDVRIGSSMAECSTSYSVNGKHKRKRNVCDESMKRILLSDGKDVEGFREVAEFGECLCDQIKGKCLLFGELYRGRERMERCVCPVWLKMVLKGFRFVNVFAGLLHMRGVECITREVLEESLKRVRGCGLDRIHDRELECLAVLCPKVSKNW